MRQIFQVNNDHANNNILTIHPAHIKNAFKYISFGMKKVPINLCTTEDLNINELYLSENIIASLGIPLFCDYEITVQDDTIILGPYIGILTPTIKKGLYRYLKDLNSYVVKYSEIGGSIVAFTLEDIDPESKNIIKGYIFNPQRQDWEVRNDIPYPSSIFNKCKVTENPKWSFLSSMYREKIFNYPTFHKWEMYNWFQKDPILKSLLPETILCTKPRDVLRFIQKYHKAYLKPIGGTFAKGIIEITLAENIIFLRYQKRKQTIYQTLENKKRFVRFFKKLLRRGQFLIQEAINLLSINDQIIDFRQIYLKNKAGLWEDVGLFARYGKPGSAVSNLTAGGISKLGDLALKELLSEGKTKEIHDQIAQFCKLASSTLEKQLIQCGNLGFDFAIDKHHKLWIIEINNEDPDHRIAYISKRKDLLYYARQQNLLYSKFLAGFTY